MLATLLFVASSAWSVQAASPTTQAAPKAPLARVVVIGASLASGFGTQRTFAEAFAASVEPLPRAPLGLGDFLFFTSPYSLGSQQVEAALNVEPSMVLAIDFLFWFGYGSLDARGGPIADESERLQLLERGLELLEEFECPLVVGDFPNMSSAVGGMLTEDQMPSATTLPLLSRRVREWAAARKDTLVLPLSELVAQLGSEGEIRLGQRTLTAGIAYLQGDQLHPTLDGMIALALVLCDDLIARGILKKDEVETEFATVRTKLRKPRAAAAGAR